MKIAVIGSGYVGTTAAAIFAVAGHKVTALDIDIKKVELINSGKAPFFEDGLNDLIAKTVKTKNLIATNDYEQAITSADVVFSCVGTPDKPDGSSDLGYIFAAAKSATKYLKSGAVFVQKSTVPVGTGRQVIKFLPKNVTYISNPEFLREGTAIKDSLLFNRIVVGGDDKNATAKIVDLHKSVAKHASLIATTAGLKINKELKDHKGEYITGQLESAELIKVTANAFLALKISFANSIAKLCDETGADIKEVMSAVGLDKRIGKAFLNAGRGYGGGCFPKDVSGLISSALDNGIDMPIMTAATETNYSMPGYIINKVVQQTGGLKNKNVAVLGLAFKAGTSDARRSPAVTIANHLHKAGANVFAYDPQANHEAESELRKGVNVCESISEAIKDTEYIFVATEWPEFTLQAILKNAKKAKIIVDCMNILDKTVVQKAGFTYIGVGR